MAPATKAKVAVNCGTLFSPRKGKCFDINGEIFVCGEVVSPTAAGIERGKIYTGTDYDKTLSLAKFAPTNAPDISLLASLSEECEVLKADRYTVQSEEINEPAAALDISSQEGASYNKVEEDNEITMETSKEKDSRLSLMSLWKSFKSSASMFQSGIALSRTKMDCPQCARKLVYQTNMVTGRAFPPFCKGCKAYFVLEDDCSGDIEALRDALMENAYADVALAFRPTEGKIIMLDEGTKSPLSSSSDFSSNIYNSITSTFSCVDDTNVKEGGDENFDLPMMDAGLSRDRIHDSESNLTDETSTVRSNNIKSVAFKDPTHYEEIITYPSVDAHLSKDIIVSSCSDTISVDITERTDEKSVERSIFSTADYSIASDNISVYTEVERRALLQDFDFM